MNKLLFGCLLFFTVFNSFAHEANEAFFWFRQKENYVEVEAELPWTMRNALLKFNPALENAKTKKEYQITFKEYLSTHLKLKNNQGKYLALTNVSFIVNKGHSHQNNYLLRFNGTDFSKVMNTVMFNLYKNQTNYNVFVNKDGEEITYKTNYINKEIKLPKFSNYTWYFVLIPFVIICLGFAVYRVYRTK